MSIPYKRLRTAFSGSTKERDRYLILFKFMSPCLTNGNACVFARFLPSRKHPAFLPPTFHAGHAPVVQTPYEAGLVEALWGDDAIWIPRRNVFSFSPSTGALPSPPTTTPHAQLRSPTTRILELKPCVHFSVLPMKIVDDFYFNLLAWSPASQHLALASGADLFLMDVHSQKQKLLPLGIRSPLAVGGVEPSALPSPEVVTAVKWMSDDLLLVGFKHASARLICLSSKKKAEISETEIKVYNSRCFASPVSNSSASFHNCFAAGSVSSGRISLFDLRVSIRSRPTSDSGMLAFHAAPVWHVDASSAAEDPISGLCFAADGVTLAAGSNGNSIFMTDLRTRRLVTLGTHDAGVKALDFCPPTPHLLASGGGLSEAALRFWDTRTLSPLTIFGAPASPCPSLSSRAETPFTGGYLPSTSSTSISGTSLQTGSQICNLAWSADGKSLLTTHGSRKPESGPIQQGLPEDSMAFWSFPILGKRMNVSLVHPHLDRVLYMAHSHDRRFFATASPDQSLRLWDMTDVFGMPAVHSSMRLSASPSIPPRQPTLLSAPLPPQDSPLPVSSPPEGGLESKTPLIPTLPLATSSDLPLAASSNLPLTASSNLHLPAITVGGTLTPRSFRTLHPAPSRVSRKACRTSTKNLCMLVPLRFSSLSVVR